MTESAENYLKTILCLKKEYGFARSIDVANRLHFSKPSVSVALKQLRTEGYITVNADGEISFTDIGRIAAENILDKYETFRTFLISLGVPEALADSDSEKLKHAISDISFEKWKEHILNSSEK